MNDVYISGKGKPWGHVGFSEQVRKTISERIVLVSAVDYETQLLKPIGSGFVLTANEETAICITAAHVLTAAVRSSVHPNQLRVANPFVPEISATVYEKARQNGRLLFTLFLEGAAGAAVAVDGFWLIDDADLCVIALKLARSPTSPLQRIGLNSDGLDTGTELITVAPIAHEIRPIESVEPRTFEVIAEVRPRIGFITEFHVKDRILKCPVYETSIPFIGGMSGGPVFLAPQPGSEATRIAIIGVISKDASSDEAHGSNEIAGCSTVIPIALAYKLEMIANGRRISFKELLLLIGIDDFGVGNQKSIG
jgi:hypothetical protein